MALNPTFGIEVESYTISIPDYRITRELLFPKRGAVERGERFHKDISIGMEYNSKVFHTSREGLFLLKAGLRKYIHKYYFKKGRKKYSQTIFLTGGWRDRFAGAHIHIGMGPKGIEYEEAQSLAKAIHDHIPFLIAITANSPVNGEVVTNKASNRLLRGTYQYFYPSLRNELEEDHYYEMNHNRGGKRKPPTLELRIFDSNVPEYLAAALTVIRAITLRWAKTRRSPLNICKRRYYLAARENAIRRGADAKLYWNNKPLTVREYVDKFFWKYRKELRQMDIPDDVFEVFKLLKRGWNGSTILRRACISARIRSKHKWQRRFAKKYAMAIERLLSGSSLREFTKHLGVKLPQTKRIALEF